MITLAQEDLQEGLRKAGLKRADNGARRDRAIMRIADLSIELVGDPVAEVSMTALPSRAFGIFVTSFLGLLCGDDARTLAPLMARDLERHAERGTRQEHFVLGHHVAGSSRLELSTIGPLMVVTVGRR